MRLTEEKIKELVVEELTKTDVIDLIKKNKDIEKKVKEITTEVITDLFKILWQHKSFYDKNISR